MPQLDSTYFISQMFWLTISFLILYIGLKFLVMPNLERVLFKRNKLIETLLAEAKLLEEQVQDLQNECDAAKKLMEEEVEAYKQSLINKFNEENLLSLKEIENNLYKLSKQELESLDKYYVSVRQDITNAALFSAQLVLQKLTKTNYSIAELIKYLPDDFYTKSKECLS